jgi:hypothetical protein
MAIFIAFSFLFSLLLVFVVEMLKGIFGFSDETGRPSSILPFGAITLPTGTLSRIYLRH